MTALVTINNINKVYSKGQVKTHALQDVSLTINKGEFIAISGASGCGKSTLLSILGLLDTPTDGHYQLANIDTQSLKIDQRSSVRNKHIGYVFQSFNLIDSLTVFENVALPLEHRGALSSTIKAAVEKQLAAVNMGARLDHKPNQLSGGQQQRAAIARALVGNPDLLLVDEPTGNLDSQNGDAVMQLLLDLNKQGATVVMVTHDERYSQMAQRQIRLFDGKVLVEHQEAVA
ncbi:MULTISPECIES: ABC transporter ATP-binding protein [unclassified Pseudoalteromonas]|uniref:ABC transporter ATP-binding protein n=1 Tax=unclassified Pseudoalteromonas TaxID=194690 RepID=UPI000C07A189|nr:MULTISPECIES: ABC transporter ATP-binding protein [unclassified Pseudoalteromonas]MDP2633540.1 ABC transporter ATP-binding protein [Pseudoalteromonas sp. 1_MG-2023]PHN90442.1 ABC transporter ATP-binding protein [Pseudoalteromonas sp. 3D05]